jgi:heme/copper-type cytochrome/quinol oxidase subunit 2
MSDDPEEFKNRQEILRLIEEGKSNYQKIEDIINKVEKPLKSIKEFQADYLLKLAEVLSFIFLTIGLLAYSYYNYNLNVSKANISETAKIYDTAMSNAFFVLIIIVLSVCSFILGLSINKYRKIDNY